MAMTITDSEMFETLRRCALRLRENPGDKDALFSIGVIYAKIGKLRESIIYLNQLSKIDSQYPGVWKLKASIFSRLGDRSLADICLRRSQRRSKL